MTYGADRTVQGTKNKSRVIPSTYFLLVSEVNGYAVGCPLCTWNEQVKTVRLRSGVISFTDDNLQMIFFRRSRADTLLAVRPPQERDDLRSRVVIGRAEQPAPNT